MEEGSWAEAIKTFEQLNRAIPTPLHRAGAARDRYANTKTTSRRSLSPPPIASSACTRRTRTSTTRIT